MFPANKAFYRPSKATRYLAILDSLSFDPELSQNELGRRANLSSAMVNQYLKDLLGQNLIRYERVNGKSYRYLLTADGEKTRQRMFSAFSSEAVQIYSALKGYVKQRLATLRARGIVKIVLYGASETCEVVLSTIRRTGHFEVLALVDSDIRLHGKTLAGYVITPPQILESLAPQAVVVTSFGKGEEIVRQLSPYRETHNVEIVTL